MGLHRVQANIIPTNERSLRLTALLAGCALLAVVWRLGARMEAAHANR